MGLPHVTTILFYVWAAAMLVAIWGVRVAQVFAKRRPRAAARPLQAVGLRVAVILPIKGVEADTESNIRALLAQDYANYRLIFAVESQTDPVVRLIGRVAAEQPAGKVELVVAGQATDRGQKVHNQLAAVDHTTEADEVLMFMDADARPGPDWLHALVVPLTYGSHIGATTGYRFYVPATRHPANAVLSVINAGVAALFGPYRRTFAWGGSMAIRRADFFAYGVHEAWQNAVSDDYVLSHCVKQQAKRKIHFVPHCMVASVADASWGSFFEFAVRQYRITRICAPLVWLVAVGGPTLFLVSFFYTLGYGLYRAVCPQVDQPWEPVRLGAMFLSLYILSMVRGRFLLSGAKAFLPEQYPAIARIGLWYTALYPLVQMINLVTLLGAACGRRIVWRGVRYTMCSRTQTRVEARTDTPAPKAELAGAACGGGRPQMDAQKHP